MANKLKDLQAENVVLRENNETLVAQLRVVGIEPVQKALPRRVKQTQILRREKIINPDGSYYWLELRLRREKNKTWYKVWYEDGRKRGKSLGTETPAEIAHKKTNLTAP